MRAKICDRSGSAATFYLEVDPKGGDGSARACDKLSLLLVTAAFPAVPDLPQQVGIAVIGAGAAGLATGIFIGHASGSTRGPRVLVLEGAKRPGAKILVSGGSRCNVTNASVTERDFWTSGSIAVIRRILRAFPVSDTIAWFARMGVVLREEQDGKLFPVSNRARDVLQALLTTLDRSGGVLAADARVLHLSRGPSGFVVETPRGNVEAQAVVLATGGRALPKSGSDGAGYEMAAALGHRIVPTTPALAPLVFSTDAADAECYRRLAGVTHRVELTVWVDGGVHARFEGSMLWTHVGISGPAALNASRHVERARIHGQHVRVTIGLVPEWSFEQIDAHLTTIGVTSPQRTVLASIAPLMPAAVAEMLLEVLGLPPAQRLSQLRRGDRRRLARAMEAWELPVSGARGYTHAEATAGGVDLSEIDPKTMQSRICPGLYLVGEVLDVDGRLGGFNFQWAWASANVAGTGLGRVRGF
jgi:predicted Rossmann fold flavoprotein